MVESFYLSYDLPVVTIRPFNTYGPRQSARAVIPTIISQALTQDFIQLGNLDARRDLTFISDIVDGFLRAAQKPDVEGKTINLGSGIEVSIGDLADKIIELVDLPVKVEIDPERLRPEKSEVQRLLADNQLAQQYLGWKPQVELTGGLNKTIVWIREHMDRYQPDRYQV